MLTSTISSQESIAEALDFEHEHEVIDGFMSRYNVSAQEAKEIFEETKKWLWLASKAPDDAGIHLAIDKPLLIIDEMWHNFILHTRRYHQFCMEKLNKFIHHTPTTSAQKKIMAETMEKNPIEEVNKRKQTHYKQLSYIYDQLGPETVMKWYEELPSKYTPQYLSAIKK